MRMVRFAPLSRRVNTTLLSACFLILILFSASLAQAVVTVSYGDMGGNNSFQTTGNTTAAGWCVTGFNTTNCGPNHTRQIAVPFTPAGQFLLTQVQLPLNYFSGANSGTVQIVNNANAVPGTRVLESWTVSNLPAYPSATLTTLNANPKIFLYGGVQYWLVVSASNDTLLWWWGNVFNLFGPENSLDSLPWSPADGTLPAFNIIGTADVPDPNAAGCSGTNPQVCWPSPQQNPNLYKYGYNLVDNGNNDIFVPLIDPNSAYTFTITDATGSEQIGFDLAQSKTAFDLKQSVPAFAWDVKQNVPVGSVWPSGSVPANESAFANPVALLHIAENGDTNIKLEIDNTNAPADGPIEVDGSLLAGVGSLATGGAVKLLDPLRPGQTPASTLLASAKQPVIQRTGAHSILLDPPLPGRPMQVSGAGLIPLPDCDGVAAFAFQATQPRSGPVTGTLRYFNPENGNLLWQTAINSLVVAGNTASFSGACTGKKACNFTVTVVDDDSKKGFDGGPKDSFSISGAGVKAASGHLIFGSVQIQYLP